jgi:hypothetical protein
MCNLALRGAANRPTRTVTRRIVPTKPPSNGFASSRRVHAAHLAIGQPATRGAEVRGSVYLAVYSSGGAGAIRRGTGATPSSGSRVERTYVLSGLSMIFVSLLQ